MQRRRFGLGFVVALLSAASQADGPLSPERAFWMRVRSLGVGLISVDFRTVDGYILYADRFEFQLDGKGVKVELPPAQYRFDKALGKRVAYYEGGFSAVVKIHQSQRQHSLSVFAQGCAVEWGVCYPPMRRDFFVG